MDQVSLVGKTVIVTGANNGIGKETARELARRGARVIMACRDEERATAAREEIVKETKNENVIVKLMDLASLESINKFADDFEQHENRLDILINNAGVWTTRREVTSDGFEMTFGVNHLGHFYLTNLLLDKLKASAPSRIVTVSGEIYNRYPLDFDDLQIERNWSVMKGYCRSKTANILFSAHLAKLLNGTGVTTYCLHPGVFPSGLVRDLKKLTLVKCCAPCLRCIQRQTVEEGALTTLYCCLEPKLADESGLYYDEYQRQKRTKQFATDPELAERLWRISEELCKL